MDRRATYRTTNLPKWNENRRGEVELDVVARVYLGDAETSDRDRIAFALRELHVTPARSQDPAQTQVDPRWAHMSEE